MILAEINDIAVPLTVTLSDVNGGVTGATVVASVYDSAAPTNKWLNMTTGDWQSNKSTKALTEVGAGAYFTTADVSNAVNSHLVAYYEVTAGGLGVSEEPLILTSTLDPATAGSQMTLQAGAITSSSYSANALTAAALASDAVAEIVAGVWDRILAGNHDTAGSSGEILQGAGAGGVAPSVISAAVWDVLLDDHRIAETFGAWANSTDLSNLDDSVRILAEQLARAGVPILNINRTIYAGNKGDTFTFSIYQDDNLLDDSVIATATNIDITFETLDGGTTVTVTGVPILGGQVGYTLVAADGVFEAADNWKGQADLTMPDTTHRFSEIRRFRVEAPL